MLAFVRIQKTAGTTVLRILRREYGIGHCDVEPWTPGGDFTAEDLRRLRHVYPRLKSIAGHAVRPYGDLATTSEGLRFFTFLREPVARCASHYQHDVRVHGYAQDIDAWLSERSGGNRQTRFLAGELDLDAAIDALERLFFVGLVEAFEESLELFRRAVGDPRLDVSYRSANVSSETTIRDRLLADPTTRARLESANELDRKLYEHALRVRLPRQRAELGPVDEGLLVRLRQGREVPRSWPGYPLNVTYRNLIYKPLVRMSWRRHRRQRRRTTSSPSRR